MNELILYKNPDNSLQVEIAFEGDTFWLSLNQIALLFERDKSVISRHIKNILVEGELTREEVFRTVAKNATVQVEGKRAIKREILYYSLDIIIAVGYRVSSIKGTQFRIWATKKLNEYLSKGFLINYKQIEKNKAQFLETLEDLKLLAQNNEQIEAKDIISLIQNFSDTFFALDSYDKNEFPSKGTKEEIQATATELKNDLQQLKIELIKNGEASNLFAQEKKHGNIEGIYGSVFQSVFGEDAYPTVEEKAAQLLYFIIKNHPFNDGNKRSGAFSFVWLLHKAGYDFREKISPETLTTLTILIAESNPADKGRMIGIVLLLLNSDRR
jgi:death-on-curing family protein